MNPKYSRTNEKKPTPGNLLLSFVIAASFLCITISDGQAATAFNGALKSVSITDSAGANVPPVAVIEYTKSAATYVFDGSKSSDPDGSIASYKWDFGDGTKMEGASVNHDFTSAPPYSVTLTVADNSGGICISQTSILGFFLSDSFTEVSETGLTSHTPENGGAWAFDTNIGASALVVGSTGVRSTSSSSSFAYNNASTGSTDYSVTVEGATNGIDWTEGFGPCIRMKGDGSGYCAVLQGNGVLRIMKKSKGDAYWYYTRLAPTSGINVPGFAPSTKYLVSISMIGTNITSSVNYGGALIATLNATDATYPSQGSAGFFINKSTPRLINIEAK